MTATSIIQQIDSRLEALKKGENRSWAQIGLLLDQVDHSGYWKNSSNSFTEWLKALCPSISVKEASLWRYLTAARFYKELQNTLNEIFIGSPPLDELSNKVSPENLEILSKIARVTPESVFLNLARQVIDGNITRAKLRETWQAFRPALEGKTARGKGVAVPKIDIDDSSQLVSMHEAQIFLVLSASGAKWTGIETPDCYQLFMKVSPEFPSSTSKNFIFDAVATVRANKSDSLLFHGIEIRGNIFTTSVFELLDMMKPYCDYLWIAINEDSNEMYELVPDYVGLLLAIGNSIQVLRPAQLYGQSDLHTGRLAKGLLLKMFGR